MPKRGVIKLPKLSLTMQWYWMRILLQLDSASLVLKWNLKTFSKICFKKVRKIFNINLSKSSPFVLFRFFVEFYHVHTFMHACTVWMCVLRGQKGEWIWGWWRWGNSLFFSDCVTHECMMMLMEVKHYHLK